MELQPVIPFEPVSTDTLPRGSQWVAQVKWDGVRILTYWNGTRLRLFNRRLNERTGQYPEIQDILAVAKPPSLILDGEIIALEKGKPSFYRVMKRDALSDGSKIKVAQRNIPINYMVFDILYYHDRWITHLPLGERQHLLSRILPENGLIQTVDNFLDSEELYQAVQAQELEGVVVKDLASSYLIGGKDGRWQKKKPFRDLTAYIGGVTYRYTTVNSLLLGLPEEKGCLRYIGHAGTGKLTHQDWRNLTETIQPLIKDSSPFCTVPPRFRKAQWVEPILAVKVNFLEWTPDGTMRHPSIQAIL